AHVAEGDRSVAHADQPADDEPDRVEQAAHLAVAPLPQNDVAPDVRAGASPKLDRLDPRRTVLELDALSKPLDLLRIRLPEQPHRILALEPVARMHQPMCERAVGREEQQPRCVQIEPPDADPPSARRRRQRVEYRAPALRVVTRSDLA